MALRAKFMTGAVAVSLLIEVSPVPSAAQSLRESAQSAVKTNPRVDVVTYNRQAVEQELARARGLYLPQVDLRAGIGPEWSDNNNTRARNRGSDWVRETRKESQLTLTQRICDGWEADSEVERQKARGQSAARRVGETSEFVALDAIEAHIEVLRQRQLVRLSDDNVTVHRDIINRVRQRVNRGASPAADLEQAQARLDTALATLIETKGALEEADNRYFYVVNQRAGQLAAAEMPAVAMPASLEAAIERARAQNRTIRITESDVTVAEREIGGAESAFYPKLNAELGASRNRDLDGVRGNDNDVTALLVLRWNLYRGGSDLAQRRVALGRMSQAMAQRQVAFRNAEEETRRSWVQYQTATERLPVLTSAVNQNRAVRDAYNRQFFNQGQRSLIDVLNAENELFVSTGRLVSAQQSRIFAAYRMLGATGDLLTHLALEVPPEADETKRAPIPTDPRPTRQ